MSTTLTSPADLSVLTPDELDSVAGEIREQLVDTLRHTGGHLGSNLGVVELTLALHRVFRSPFDRLVFDTGHQAYVHKMLTGRAARLPSLRQAGGLSGYPSRRESAHDLVENSHASTALSYADGLAAARELRGEEGWVVAVIGDGALTGGMAWEGMNNLAAAAHRRVLVLLNDNGRSYSDTVGGLADHLSALRGRDPRGDEHRQESVFEALGLGYVGPVDGHDRAAVEDALRLARAGGRTTVVHCVTRKGAGHPPAEADPEDRYHTVRGLDEAGFRLPGAPRTYTSVFSDALLESARSRRDVVAVTAAMAGPTGVAALQREMPTRVFDVGIAEQHAVTSAAGLAMGGMHPVVAIYSTFLNRAFDQVLLDVGLHRLPVTFVLDRAGVTGPDGPSHHGMWDLGLLRTVPGLSVAAPRDARRLVSELDEALDADGPTVVRFPSGTPEEDLPALGRVGGMDLLRDDGVDPDVLVVAVGPMARPALEAAATAAHHGLRVTVLDPRWAWPVPDELTGLAASSGAVLTVEDGLASTGLGTGIAHHLSCQGVPTPVRVAGLDHAYLAAGPRPRILADHGLDAPGLVRHLLEIAPRRSDLVPSPSVRQAYAAEAVSR